MTDPRPAPLVPAEVDLRGFETMPLAVQMVRDSRFVSEVKPEAFRAGFLLWCASWHQVPAGSIPDNDVELAKLAGYGFAVSTWKRLRKEALMNFVLCSDGRYYHREVAARALVAWQSRLEHFYERAKERLRKANKARADEKPPRPPLPALSFEQWNDRRLSGGVPMEKADSFDAFPAVDTRNSGGSQPGIPPENALKGEGTERRGNGELKEIPPTPPPPAPAAPPPTAPPLRVGTDDPPEVEGFKPTPAGAVCKALRLAGIGRTNPSHPTLLALLAAGATEAELVALAPKAKGKHDPFAYLLEAAVGMRQRAAEQAGSMVQGSLTPANPTAWRADERGIRAMQQQLSVDPPRDGESMNDFEARVTRAWRRAGEPAPRPTETA